MCLSFCHKHVYMRKSTSLFFSFYTGTPTQMSMSDTQEILPTKSSPHFKSCLLLSRSATLRFPTVGCFSTWLNQLHYLVVLQEIKSYLSLLCLHLV